MLWLEKSERKNCNPILKFVLTDELIAATQPLDTSGADEIVETPDIPDEEKADD